MRIGTLLLLFAALSVAQTSRYGPSRTWWDAGQDDVLGWDGDYDNATGQLRVSNKNGAVRTKDHAFFQPLGNNGRACVTCHQPSNAMSVSAAAIRQRWEETEGKDPIFAAIDGSNCPDLPQGEKRSHSLLLERGLFRIALPWPPKDVTPDFRIEVVKDPTGCNTGRVHGVHAANPEISVYRRPRMAANLTKLVPGPAGVVLMADGREPTLQTQAITAALVHEGAKSTPGSEQLRQILDFETQVSAQQYSDIRAGLLQEGAPNSSGMQAEFRTAIARGRTLFAAQCAQCHQPETTRWMDAGTTNRREADAGLPLFRITCDAGRVIYSQDPGRALVSGKCADVGAIVVPQFRGLAARAPYFANGSAAMIEDLVEYYNTRLGLGFTAQ